MDKGHVSLDILVIGAGLGGLAAAISCALSGHHVVVLEAARQMGEIGAGLQITPNASKLLFSWGLQQQIETAGSEPLTLQVLRYSDGKPLTVDSKFNEHMRSKYGAPFIDIHRGDLHTFLVRHAQELGVRIETSSRVSNVDIANATVTTESGAVHSADLLVGGDGLWSKCREALLNRTDAPLPTGDLAYRIVLHIDTLKDPQLRDMVATPACRFWIGPDAHVVAYSMRGANMYNVVLLCPDDLPVETARQAGSVEEMKAYFKDWDPVLMKLLDNVDAVDKWKLMHRVELEKWVADTGTLALLGDACHPMLPYLAQGANSALEDGAVLGRVLNGITAKSQIKDAMKIYEKVRKSRSEAIARETFEQRAVFHMLNGEAQQVRDKIFLATEGGRPKEKFPSRWTCPEVQPWLYGYDAIGEADRAVREAGGW